MGKIRIKDLFYHLIAVYPLVNITVCYIFDGDNMNLFSWSYCMLLCVINVCLRHGKIGQPLVVIGVWLTGTIILAFIREEDTTLAVGALLYAGTVFYMQLFSPSEKSQGFNQADMIRHGKEFLIAQILYILVLSHYISRFGLRAGWNTWVLQGPYNYPHTLAYMLLLMLMGDLFFFLKTRNKCMLVIGAISVLLIAMTAVRTALLSATFVLLFLLKELFHAKHFQSLTIILFLGIAALCAAERYGLLNALLRKNALAIAQQSFSNGRVQIALASIQSLRNYPWGTLIGLLIGTGMTALTNSNLAILGASIHAHNDFIDILVCYGIFNFIVYCFLFWNFTKKGRFWLLLTLGIMAFGNGLYVYIDAIPMIVMARLLFESGDRRARNIKIVCRSG